MDMATQINNHLASGGVVQITTYLKSWLYTSKHVGWFKMINGNLHVANGNKLNRLSNGDNVLVSIRFGNYAKKAA